MAYVERGDARIFWDTLGSGDPVVLVMGLGCSSAMWFRIAPQLARHYRVILLDNRGSGKTRVRNALVHRVSTMAQDVGAVLDAAGEARAHIVGFSMGGMISQQFTLDFPERVRSLTLLGTHPGGIEAVQAPMHVRQLLFDKANMTARESLEQMRPHTYASKTPDSLFEEDAVVRLSTQSSIREYQAQLYGLLYWSVYPLLPQLTAPTLVMHGAQDGLIPLENGRMIASRVPNATLVEMPEASHWLMTDQNAQCVRAIKRHLKAH